MARTLARLRSRREMSRKLKFHCGPSMGTLHRSGRRYLGTEEGSRPMPTPALASRNSYSSVRV